MLTGSLLPLEDLKTGGYIDLVEPDEYYTVTQPRPVRRQRIKDNLLGDAQFCPMIRRTDTLRGFEKADLPARCRKIVSSYSPQLLKRAMSCLYTKETKSSFEIEHIKPNSTRTERFIDMTPQTEALFRFIEQSIDTELVNELAFLANYEETKKAIQDIVDMPDRKIDLFIQACLQDNGQLSARKRASHFDFLSDVEVAYMGEAVRSAYGCGEGKEP